MTPTLPAVLRSLVRRHHWLLWLTVAIATGNGLLSGYFVASLADPERTSLWESAGVPSRVMLFVVGILVTPMILPPYVGQGITRRTFTAATGLAGLLFALVTAAYLAAGYLVERAVFAAAGRPHLLGQGHLFSGVGQVHLVVAEYTLAYVAYLVSGLLVGTAYYRLGGWIGTLALPLGLVPVVAVENALGGGWVVGLGPSGADDTLTGMPAAAALCVAAAAVGLGGLAVRALTRTLPIKAGRMP